MAARLTECCLESTREAWINRMTVNIQASGRAVRENGLPRRRTCCVWTIFLYLSYFISKSLKISPTLFFLESTHVLSNLKGFLYRIRECESREMCYYVAARCWCSFLSHANEKVIEFLAKICSSISTICRLLGRRSLIFTKEFHAAELFLNW